jgi:hypothetical protein
MEQPDMASNALELVKKDVLAIARGACVAAVGAAVAYLANLSFDMTTPNGIALAAVASVAVNAARKYLLPQV